MYLSLAVELLFFPVPSVASSYNLWSTKADYKMEMKEAEINISDWSILRKSILLGIPIALICLTFSLPILYTTKFIDQSRYCWVENSGSLHIFWIVPFIVMALGRGLSFYSVLKIRKDNEQVGDSFDLKNSSVYRRTRNPIQLGMYLFAFGLMLLYPTPLFIGGIIFYILYMDYKIKIEEKFLLQKYGEEYAAYFSATKRYL